MPVPADELGAEQMIVCVDATMLPSPSATRYMLLCGDSGTLVWSGACRECQRPV